MATTQRGRNLRQELNDAMRRVTSDHYIGYEHLETLSKLARAVATYSRRQEEACCYEWASGDKWDKQDERLEKRIRDLVAIIPYVESVEFGGDPRGFTVKLILECGASNSWGGVGFGIA